MTTLIEYCKELTKNGKTLREIAEADEARISKTIQKDPHGREYKWNGDHFESEPDENGKTWVLGVDSAVPGFWFYCPEITGHNSKGFETKCSTPHFVFIYQDGEKLTCRGCKKEVTVNVSYPGKE
ncbi:hypothetical protein [Nitrosopumilus sp.]|uniref:hypothetical protein n=1 Tax=Nitrosopumilus sp. TaxID=2024843 RepID=UPI003D0DFCDC